MTKEIEEEYYVGLRDVPKYEYYARRGNILGTAIPSIRKMGTTIFENDAARLWDGGDDIAVLSVDTKLGILNVEALESIIQACDVAERGHAGLVLWRGQSPFSYGVNLKEVMGFVNAGQLELANTILTDFQTASMRLKHCHVPTVAAIQGVTLGGSSDLQMHAHKTVSAQNSYVGLVEIGIGLLPAVGGIKEFAMRAARQAAGGDIVPYIKPVFENITRGKVSSSAENAIELGFMTDDDLIVSDSQYLLHVALHQAKAMANSSFRPASLDEKVRVAGKQGRATLLDDIIDLKIGGFMSEHDYYVADRIAFTLSGGDVDSGTEVSQEWLLKLENECFFELIQTEKTLERINHMLTEGTLLKN